MILYIIILFSNRKSKYQKGKKNMNTKALFQLSYGLFVAATKADKKMNGCIINTVTQVTSDPQQVIMAVNKQNLTCELIQKSGMVSISILSESAPFSLFQHFGFQSGKDVDKFVDMPFALTKQELPYLTEHTTAYLDCKVVHTYDLGTHMMFLATITDMDVISSEKPMTYAYYHANVKPKPTAAPSDSADAPKGWRCSVCGYVYEGEELPPDFVCPWCKHGAADFEKIK